MPLTGSSPSQVARCPEAPKKGWRCQENQSHKPFCTCVIRLFLRTQAFCWLSAYPRNTRLPLIFERELAMLCLVGWPVFSWRVRCLQGMAYQCSPCGCFFVAADQGAPKSKQATWLTLNPKTTRKLWGYGRLFAGVHIVGFPKEYKMEQNA